MTMSIMNPIKQFPTLRAMIYRWRDKRSMPAWIVKRYSRTISYKFCDYDDYGREYCEYHRHSYDDLIDVIFDDEPNRVSRGHFTWAAEPI